MAKRCLSLGEYVPYGQEFLGDEVGGVHQFVANERDGILAEEELYVAGDGRVVWSSGRHVVRGFQAPSRALQALLCSFSALPVELSPEGTSGAGAAAAPSGAPAPATGRCLGILEPDRLTVHAPSGAEFLVHAPLRAVHAWPLADGILLLVCSPHGSHHAISLLGHPLNLPRCVSYIGLGAAVSQDDCKGDVWKDALPTGAEGGGPGAGARGAQLRWVSRDLPLAVAHLGASGRHAVLLLRRRVHAPAVAVPESGAPAAAAAFEAPAMCREPSEVFLQALWLFPGAGPACEHDDVQLLAPDPEFARAGSGGAGGGADAPGLLLALFVRATRRVCIVRLWSWEVVATLEGCSSAVPLLPSDDLRTRTACPSGLAGFPSRWYGADHCRVVFQEHNSPPLPDATGLPQPWTDLLLDPLELTRTSAVHCFDRHRLPQYLLTLDEEQQTLTLHWGAERLCRIEIDRLLTDAPGLSSPIARLCDPIANRFTLQCQDGKSYRCAVPLQPQSPRLAAVLTALALLLPTSLAHHVASDAQVWCVRHAAGRAPSDDDDDVEWRHFCELVFCLAERALAGADDAADAPPFKRARVASGGDGAVGDEPLEPSGSPDWEWMLGSSVHARERLEPRYAGLSASTEFVPHRPLREIAANAASGSLRGASAPVVQLAEGQKAVASPEGADVWEGETATPPHLLLEHIDCFFLVLHLLYEEWKMHSLHARLLPPLALLLYGLAARLQCFQFMAFYAQDNPAVRDPALAMATLGGYGAWLWRVFAHGDRAGQEGPQEKSAGTAPVAEAVFRLRAMPVPHLLHACRCLQAGSGTAELAYPAVFPLSRLLLSVLRALQGGTCESWAALSASHGPGLPRLPRPPSTVRIPGVDLASCGPPSPLPPLGAPQRAAQEDAERARAMRRWLQGPRGPGARPPWEAVLLLLVQQQAARADADLWGPALAVPVEECLRAAAEQPGGEWPVEAYALVGREDLALLARGDGDAEPPAAGRGARELLDAAAGLPGAGDEMPPSADPLESSEWLHRMFDRDRRAAEVARLLSSSRPVALRVARRPEQTDHDFEHYKQSRLGLAAGRQAAVCVGRGAFTLGAVRPLPTELLPAPALTLAGRFPPQAAVVSLDPSHHSPELNVWAEFSNGVATALQVSDAPGVEVTRGWILHHRSEASASGQSSAHAHAGFLCGLGLRGSLKVMPVADCYRYLRLQHDTTSVAVILGMAASHIGSMDAGLTRMCCVHIPSMLPATYSDMEVASPVQCTAVLSLGLLFARSAHRMMTELLVAEIGRRPSDRALHDREGYSLAAGFALGCICLGLGADAPGLADLQLHTWLLRYIHGGPAMPMPGAATHDQKLNPNHDPATCSSLITEPDGINVSVTSPGGCVALALIFLRTNCEAVASRIVIPQNVFQLDYIRPDFAMLRLVARSLIMWDDIRASDDWVERQLPPFLLQLEADARRAGAAAGAAAPGAAAARGPAPAAAPGAPRSPGPAASPETPPPGGRGEGAAAPGAGAAREAERGAGGWADVDWLLVGQTRASLVAGACLAVGLRFAGTSDQAAKGLLISRLRAFRDARRSEAHPALMASLPTPAMDLDRSTLEACQSVTAVSLGMVMAGTGDLDALRVLRSLRKHADLETSYGVHMATHMAIGFLFLGGGRYTFDQDPLSIAALLMAAFPRFPTSLTDNRCHLQAFRHLYVLAARHRCVEAVEVDTRQPVDVRVRLEAGRGPEAATLPRLLLAAGGGGLRALALRSERYWPVAIRRAAPEDGAAAGRWMRSLEATRRLYVKRRSGHLPHRLDHLGAQGAEQAWFPSYTAPEPHHLERLLQIPRAEAGAAPQQLARVGGLVLAWLLRAGAEGGGPLEPGTLAMSSAEWAAALCCAPPPLLPPGTCEFDFEGDGDGSLVERFGKLLSSPGTTDFAEEHAKSANAGGLGAQQREHPPHVRFAHWLHECIIESKLAAYPLLLRLYLQTQHVAGAREAAGPPAHRPTSAACSALALDQLVTVEQFYQVVCARIDAKHRPLLSEEFLAARCAAVRGAFLEGGVLAKRLSEALRSRHARSCGPAAGNAAPLAGAVSGLADDALVALYSRLHGLPGDLVKPGGLLGTERRGLAALPRLRRLLPGASAQGLRRLIAILEVGAT